MPTLMLKSTTACTSSSRERPSAATAALLWTALWTARLGLAGLALGLLGCDRFPRNNPNDPGATGDLVVMLGTGEDIGIIVNDSDGLSRFNNDNQIIETRETIELTIPLEIARSNGDLSAAVTLESENNCVAAIETRIPIEIALPRTTGSSTSEVSAGPFEMVMGDMEACGSGAELDFVLKLRLIQQDITLRVPFDLELLERDGMVAITQVVIDDQGTDRQGDLDPNEEVALYITLENQGVLLREVQGYVSQGGLSCVARVRISGTPTGKLQFFDIRPNETAIAQGTLELTVDSTCDSTQPVEMVFVVEDNAKQEWLIPIEIEVKDPPINPQSSSSM